MQPTQQHLIFQLENLRQCIIGTFDKDLMLAKATEAYELALPVPIDPAFQYKIEGKSRTLSMLQYEIQQFRKSSSEIEVIQFQLSSTILMLSLQFIEGSLNSMQLVLNAERKIA